MNGSTAVATLPPTDLIRNGGTKSSKASTSSLPSTFQLDEGGILNGMDDLEEIGLDDDHDRSRGRPQGRTRQRGSFSSPNPLRDLTHAQLKRPPYPTIQTTGSLPTHTQSVDYLAAPATSARSKKFHSTPTLHERPGPRNPSPRPHAIALSPTGNGVAPLPLTIGFRPKASPTGPRRTSWPRKTSDQLEEEYDSDDEVPADVILDNVPLTPSTLQPQSNPSSPVQENAQTNEATGSGSPPTQPVINKQSAPLPAIPTNGAHESIRSKSWSDAMLALGEEAKELSEALERHAEQELLQTERRLQRQSDPRPVKKPLPTPVTVMELPPLQISNGIIDPLPISKEKEAVLSRTRPSWLPPKSKDEEKRHLKEYQRMMRRSQEAERKRIQKERQEQEAKDRQQNEHSNVWETQIIPYWNRATRSPEARELWWKGVTPRCRGTVWSLAYGNHLAVSAETFRLALRRAKDIENGLKKAPSMYSAKEREIFGNIQRDVKQTFPDLKIFQECGPLHENLLDVLMAYSMYRSDVGYVYGTHVVAALLLLNQSSEQAFVTLANMLNRPMPLAFFTQDQSAMSRSYNLFVKAFQYKLPSLYRHMHLNLRIDPVLYLEPMFLTLFSLHCPVDVTSRIWDVYAFEGDSFLVRTAVGILMALESKLYGDRDEVLGILGWNTNTWLLGKDDEFMNIVRSAGKEEAKLSPTDRL